MAKGGQLESELESEPEPEPDPLGNRSFALERRMLHPHCTLPIIIINFPAKLNFNAAAEMKTKIASIEKIAKKSSGCCEYSLCLYLYVCVFACLYLCAGKFYWAPPLYCFKQ